MRRLVGGGGGVGRAKEVEVVGVLGVVEHEYSWDEGVERVIAARSGGDG